MSLLLIDDKGEVWDNPTIRERESFSSYYAEDEFSTYLAKNLGFVAINIYGRSCQVRFRPRIISRLTLLSLTEWLGRRRFDRMVLTVFVNQWHSELVSGQAQALEKIQGLIARHNNPGPADFLAQTLSIDAATTVPMFRSLLENLTAFQTNAQVNALRGALQQMTQGRYMVMNLRSDADRLVYTDVGFGYTTYDPNWVVSAPGSPVDAQPDLSYGRWINSVFIEALKHGQPKLEQVDAIVSTERKGRIRLRYKRIILPILQNGSSKSLLSASVLDDRIDLRIQSNR